jgi:hypothetical protein
VRDPHGKDAPPAVLSTQIEHTPLHILPWVVQRWRMEVPCEAARAHRGRETQSQWSDVASARTTPGLWGLFSIVPWLADRWSARQPMPVRLAAGDTTALPTFAEAMALARRCWWGRCHFATSRQRSEVLQVPRSLLERFTDAVCYAE